MGSKLRICEIDLGNGARAPVFLGIGGVAAVVSYIFNGIRGVNFTNDAVLSIESSIYIYVSKTEDEDKGEGVRG